MSLPIPIATMAGTIMDKDPVISPTMIMIASGAREMLPKQAIIPTITYGAGSLPRLGTTGSSSRHTDAPRVSGQAVAFTGQLPGVFDRAINLEFDDRALAGCSDAATGGGDAVLEGHEQVTPDAGEIIGAVPAVAGTGKNGVSSQRFRRGTRVNIARARSDRGTGRDHHRQGHGRNSDSRGDRCAAACDLYRHADPLRRDDRATGHHGDTPLHHRQRVK